MTDDEIRELLELEAKATKGPWVDGCDCVIVGMPTFDTFGECNDDAEVYEVLHHGDRHLVVAARNAIRPLAEEVLRLREELKRIAAANNKT